MQHSIIRKGRIRHLMNSFDVFVIKGFTVEAHIQRIFILVHKGCICSLRKNQ